MISFMVCLMDASFFMATLVRLGDHGGQELSLEQQARKVMNE